MVLNYLREAVYWTRYKKWNLLFYRGIFRLSLALLILSLFLRNLNGLLSISAQDEEVVSLLGKLSQLSVHVDPGSQSGPSHPYPPPFWEILSSHCWGILEEVRDAPVGDFHVSCVSSSQIRISTSQTSFDLTAGGRKGSGKPVSAGHWNRLPGPLDW